MLGGTNPMILHFFEGQTQFEQEKKRKAEAVEEEASKKAKSDPEKACRVVGKGWKFSGLGILFLGAWGGGISPCFFDVYLVGAPWLDQAGFIYPDLTYQKVGDCGGSTIKTTGLITNLRCESQQRLGP